jgi:hypothetical protein
MANICLGYINVRGYKDNVEEFIQILQADYSYCNKENYFEYVVDRNNFSHIPHFFRIFETNIIEDVMLSGVYRCVILDIECAWSVYCCMFNGPHSYYYNFQRDHLGNHFGTHILQESKRLNLEIEIWSYESGMAFQEHYKICSGILVKDEEYNFNEYYIEDISLDEFKELCGERFPQIQTQEQLDKLRQDNGPVIVVDEQEETYDFGPSDQPKYLANLVMVKKED